MSPPSGSRPPAAGDPAGRDRAASARVDARHAVAAFEAINGLGRAETLPAEALPPVTRHGLGQDHARLARALCALRHLADQYPGLSFTGMLDAAHEQYSRPGADNSQPGAALGARLGAEAIGICERAIAAPRQYSGGFWPPDTLASLRGHAGQHGLSVESAVAALTTRLMADLRHYADHQGTDFQQALAAGLAAHARHRLSAEGPFETGQDPDPGHAPQAAAPFPPCATHQGVVIAVADAEWLLVRTAARNLACEQNGLRADRRDADDERVLIRALAAASGRPVREVFAELVPGIAARIMQLEDGPAAAAELGREHGRTGTPPYCDLKTEGDAAALMRALGETEAMTDANHQYRVLLVTGYAIAYRHAAGRGPAPAGSPALIAARDFPQANPLAAPADTPDAPDIGRGSRAAPQDRPHPGPRPGA